MFPLVCVYISVFMLQLQPQQYQLPARHTRTYICPCLEVEGVHEISIELLVGRLVYTFTYQIWQGMQIQFDSLNKAYRKTKELRLNNFYVGNCNKINVFIFGNAFLHGQVHI